MFKLLPTTELLPHQSRYVEVQLEKKALGCFDAPGLGKSLEVLAAICAVGKPALVVCPPHLANNWMAEVTKFTELKIGSEIEICPYTMFSKRVTSLKKYGFFALDEGHYCKNLEAKRTQAIHSALCDHNPEFLANMTGTPVMNRIPDIYSFLVMLSYYDHVTPKIIERYPTSYQFCMRFCNVSEARFGGRSVMQFTGLKNAEELIAYLRPWTIRRTADQVLKLPSMESQTVTANYKHDPKLEAEWQNFVEGGSYSPTAKKESALAKAHFTAEYVKNELESDNGPIVVFTDHPDAAYSIERELSGSYRVATIVGGMSIDRRSEYVKQFQKGQLHAIVLTIGSSSTGITLTKASTIVFNDICWTPEDLNQARQRIHRIGQERPTRCVYVVGSSVDDRIIKSVLSKSKVINTISKGLGDGSSTDGDD